MAKVYMSTAQNVLPWGWRSVSFSDTKHGLTVRKRPNKKPNPNNTLIRQNNTRFGFAAVMASNAMWLDLETAIEMAKGTQQVPRDILTMAALGSYYYIENPDGTAWRHTERPVKSDPLCIRPPSLSLIPQNWPPEPVYLSLGNGWRLTLESQP